MANYAGLPSSFVSCSNWWAEQRTDTLFGDVGVSRVDQLPTSGFASSALSHPFLGKGSPKIDYRKIIGYPSKLSTGGPGSGRNGAMIV